MTDHVDTATGLPVPYLASTSGAAHVNIAGAATGVLDAQTYTAWCIGSELTTVTVSASGTGTWGEPQDVSVLDFNNASIHLINTGTGTAVLDLQVSRDGYTNPITISDVATQAGAGVTAYKFSSATMFFGHYVSARVRETGGANSAIVKACVLGRE